MKSGDIVRVSRAFNCKWIIFSERRVKIGEHILPEGVVGEMLPSQLALVIDVEARQNPMIHVLVGGVHGWLANYAQVEVVG